MSTGVQPKAPHQAQWNVQVVKGKVTTRCLWNACKALGIGLILLAIGTTMAVVGYYADQLSIRSEVRGNSTVEIKNESRGFHLNNLSYAGPIIMGIGGFIVVAACVMTFEARDSAAKVVPARFKPNLNSSVHGSSSKSTPRNTRSIQRMESKKNMGCQTGAAKFSGMYQRGMESSMSGSEWSPKNDPSARREFTAAFVQFQRELMENSSPIESHRRGRRRTSEVGLNKSPSAPDLALNQSVSASLKQEMARDMSRRLLTKASPKTGNRSHREFARPLDGISSNLLLRPNYLERQALSMDNPFYESYDCYTPPSRLSRQPSGRSGGSRESFDMELGSSAGVSGSQTSMALDLHECQVTIKVKDESASKRSETARRHQLLRQKPVEEYREEKPSRCFCASRYSCALAAEDCATKTNSSSNLKSPCRHCPKSTCGRGHSSKITADFRSQSFSKTCSYGEPKRFCCHHEDSSRIFCIEDQKRKTNLSSENIRVCCEEKLRCLKRHSPAVSPHRSPQNTVIECRVKRQEAGECLVHKGREILGNRPQVRREVKNKKPRQKIEVSLSAEDQTIIRELHKARVEETTASATTFRSASFSPTRKFSSSNSSSRNNSYTSSTSFKSPSPVTVEECEKDRGMCEEQEGQQPKEQDTHALEELH